ncbi:MAG: RNA-binding S4 domain-containing protein [Tissierellia bacterium]|nr:RNA-binding S4 domain-containing protein [Tissierellia bacterium]
MRLDKYLKNSRLIKRRTVAREACDKGHVSINGKVSKAGAEVDIGDEIVIVFGQSTVKVRVLSVEDNPGKAEAGSLYEIIEESKNH